VHNKILKLGLIIQILLVSPLLGAAELPPLTHSLTALKNPTIAPYLKLSDMDDEIVEIAALKGRVIVINFWATWCPPCRREMSSLERLHLATEDNGVTVLAVNIGEDIDTVFPFLGTIEPSPSFPILFDEVADTMGTWKIKGLPTTFIIAPDGSIAYRAVGGREFDHPDLIKKVLALKK